MAIKIDREAKDGKALLFVKGSMTVYEAENLRDEMVECFSAYDGLMLDLGGVDACDITGVQLLCSAGKTGSEEIKPFSVLRASDPVIEALVRTGFEAEKVLNPEKGQNVRDV